MDQPAPIEFDKDLSAFDFMLYRADMDAHSRTSMMFIETLETAPDLDRVRAQVDHATRAFPRLRQRVIAPLVPVTAPQWVVDPDFNLDYHFRRIALPAPGDFRQLLDLAATVHATPLDLGRPMWEAVLVEGLNTEDARAAILWKMSHTITDGVGGMVLDHLIHDTSRDPERSAHIPIPSPEDLTSLELTKSAIRRLPKSLVIGSVRGARSLLGSAIGVVREPVASTSAALKTVKEVRHLMDSVAVEPSPLLRRRGLNRRFEALDFDFAELRAAAKARGCSVNDAYLAGIAGGLGAYHEAMGMPIDAIATGMPVSVRTGDETAAGNQWSAVTLPLPLAEPNVERRMHQIREQVLTAKSASSLNPARIIAPLLAWIPQQVLAGAGTGNLGLDVQASNVPGYPKDRFFAGSRITASIPIGPLPGVAMMVTMVTMSGRCFVGIHYDTAAVTESELFLRCLTEGFAEVMAQPPAPQEATSPKATPQKKSPAKKAASAKKSAPTKRSTQ